MINQENRKQEKKNQHYVSRFYMKHFANIKNAGTPKEKVFISFYQFKGNLIKENIPTSSICSEDYFYDREGKIEDALSNMETRWGKAINHAINGSFTEEDIEIIREFVVYQIGRTKAMLAHNKEMAVNMMKYIITQKFGSITDEDAIKNLIENKVQNGITSAGGLSIAKEAVATIHDLKMKVVTNKTETRLITSDVPIIIINPVNSNCAGLLSAGEVIFFPISPWKMIFFYDSKLFDELPDRIFDENIAAIFDGNGVRYKAQAITEGNKKPDFIFPSQDAYHDAAYSTDRLVSLAAKTTCKDRWRQILNEADRLRDRPKYLCTLQQGISAAQMDEMQAENVILVVPKPYIQAYPADRRERIWTLGHFVTYVKEVENL